MRLYLYRYTFNLFCLVALILPVAKLLDVIDWSWWVIAAPLWLAAIVVLVAGHAVVIGFFLRPPS